MPDTPGSAPVRHPIDRRRALAAIGVAVLVVAAGLGALAVVTLRRPAEAPPSAPRAVIIDQLAITDPNPGFVAKATQDLQSAGYRVDYVPSQDVTVDFYRTLPARGYSFVVLRSHTSNYQGSLDPRTAAASTPVASIGLFTNELYSRSQHVAEQRTTQLMVDSYADRNIPWRYFGITPEFIQRSTRGRFGGATVVLMGCSGLETNDLAQAFLAKGATSFVSWDKPVTAEHTDAATAELLSNLLGKHLDLRQAVAQTMAAVGSDPAYGSRLVVYP